MFTCTLPAPEPDRELASAGVFPLLFGYAQTMILTTTKEQSALRSFLFVLPYLLYCQYLDILVKFLFSISPSNKEGETVASVPAFASRVNVTHLVCDFAALRIGRQWRYHCIKSTFTRTQTQCTHTARIKPSFWPNRQKRLPRA